MVLNEHCPDCDYPPGLGRRDFLKAAGVAAAASGLALPAGVRAAEEKQQLPSAENLVAKLYGTLSDTQKEEICFAWDYEDDRGRLRTHVSNNWQITEPKIASAFFSKEQQEIIEALFYEMYNPEWHDRIRKQLRDDAGGYGKSQSIAIFGEPGSGKFELVMTGRHLTIRCDGNSTEHTAFGGPIFYGHAAQGFNEKADHPGNVYWHQAKLANQLYQMLDGKQQKTALISNTPLERMVHFQGPSGQFPGLPVTELSADQREHLEKVLTTLLEPYRQSDREEARACLKAQGGLDKCAISFYQEDDIGNDGVWDNWRIEGPSFVWYYRGAPHVHVWVNVADNPSVKITTEG